MSIVTQGYGAGGGSGGDKTYGITEVAVSLSEPLVSVPVDSIAVLVASDSISVVVPVSETEVGVSTDIISVSIEVCNE